MGASPTQLTHEVVYKIAEELDPETECRLDERRSSVYDADIVLRRGEERAYVVITIEALRKAETDRAEMRQALSGIMQQMTAHPRAVFLITGRGVKEVPLDAEFREPKDADDWDPFEVWAGAEEADAIAQAHGWKAS